MPTADSEISVIPETMHAAVYRGHSVVSVEEIPTPAIRPGEIPGCRSDVGRQRDGPRRILDALAPDFRAAEERPGDRRRKRPGRVD